MKYTVSRRVIVGQTTDGPLMNIEFDEISKEDLLIRLLAEPDLAYYARDDQDNVSFYRGWELLAFNNSAVNSWAK